MNHPTLGVDQLLDILAQVQPSSPFYEHASKFLNERLIGGCWPRHPESANVESDEVPKLTIGMATFDDFDGVYFSVQAIRMFHAEIGDVTEIIVLDNNPDGRHAKPLREFLDQLEGCRYIPVLHPQGTVVRDRVFREARGEWVLCMDCHVLFEPGSLKRLIDFGAEHPASKDLFQGPLVNDSMDYVSTQFDPKWNQGMWGCWGQDERGADPDSPPFEIPMNGLGVFACRRAAWPGINPRLRAFGGEEGCLHEKFHQNGGVTWCLPFLRWIHRFARPGGVPYPCKWEDRIYNYLAWFDELALDPAPVIEHFTKHLGNEAGNSCVKAAQREFANPFHFFDAIYCISRGADSGRWDEVMRRFTKLGIERRIRRFPAFETPHDFRIGHALTHRSIVSDAKRQGLENVLVFDQSVVFSLNALEELGNSLNDLRELPWWILCLGEIPNEPTATRVPGCCYLQMAEGETNTHAVAYHAAAYQRILQEVPDSPIKFIPWLREKHDLNKFYAEEFKGQRLQVKPVIATTIDQIPRERRIFDEAVMDLEAAARVAEKMLSAAAIPTRDREFKPSIVANWKFPNPVLAEAKEVVESIEQK